MPNGLISGGTGPLRYSGGHGRQARGASLSYFTATFRARTRCVARWNAKCWGTVEDKPDEAPEVQKEFAELQVRLCDLQRWVRDQGPSCRRRVRGAGRRRQRRGRSAPSPSVSARACSVWSPSPAPSDREKGPLYLQRYLQHFPAAGEVVIFDRSWYNRAGVERVMGFCSPEGRRTVPRALSRQIETFHDPGWDHPDQAVDGSSDEEHKAALQGPHRRSGAPVEAQSDGSARAHALVPTTPARATSC